MPRKAPLDRVRGEKVEGLGDEWRVVPLSKWADTPMWDEACKRARIVFRKNLVWEPRFDSATVLVQEYPAEDRLVFLFAQWCRPYFHRDFKWMYFPCVIKLTPQLKAHLVLAGRWQIQETRH